ncbi:(S)-2-haloacid dehalogenase 1 [Aspergillus udagawae]|nr:(S)-2-haloacid dehalogenase 1 [Aspergillus udagawae]
MTDQPRIYKHADGDSEFLRKPSTFRSFVSSDPSSDFPAQKDRTCCTWKTSSSWWYLTGAGPARVVLPSGHFGIAERQWKQRDHLHVYANFDHLLPQAMREANQPGSGLYPAPLRAHIDAMNEKRTMPACTRCSRRWTAWRSHSEKPDHRPYLLGANITEADILLYTTIARFDVAY